MSKKFAWVFVLVSGLLSLGITQSSFGEEAFPAKPIEVICHRTGGSTYLSSKVVADGLSEVLKTPVVVISKSGGAGTDAPMYVKDSKPDGYTLIVANSGTNGTVPVILSTKYQNSDFDYLALYGTQPMAFAVREDAPWKTLKELAAYAKREPGKLTYSTSSIGAQSHFLMELFKIAAGGLNIRHVPFKSGAELITALLGGHVDIASAYFSESKGPLDAKKIRILAIPSEERLPDYPDIPTFAEAGYPDVKTVAWFGIGAPKGIPPEISRKLEDALNKAIHLPDVEKKLRNIGFTPTYKNKEEFTKYVADEEKLFRKIAKEANIRVE